MQGRALVVRDVLPGFVPTRGVTLREGEPSDGSGPGAGSSRHAFRRDMTYDGTARAADPPGRPSPLPRASTDAQAVAALRSPGVTVTFDPNACRHSGACVRGLPAVFHARRRTWVDAAAAPRDAVVALVARCPSGALRAIRTPEPTP